ncbi:hypothetical protein JIG36_41510 [Actinoplanes sp. LDG1-06]|uniref:SMI1/KNR4 family protein n=1 Tax=Paractinoplanes ovalisporus TaxID=2810368 RepID=A0ABS2AQD9_9ACTN|nr:hypothetical protein [Actinoplanes ovalisporus]MBM2622000.1 hypothetical protein [Actinoplanes ovalisporus]
MIEEVIMSDIGNGFFIHAPDRGLDAGAAGMVFASNGGGILYATAPDNTVTRSSAASTDSDFQPVAATLREFLGQVLAAAAHFAATKEPGDL